MLFSRIRCHFCGSKQPHSKSVTEFQCSDCEAFNYFDGKGNVVDTPAHIADPPSSQQNTSASRTFLSFTKASPEPLEPGQHQPFCRTCQQNQHLYNRILAEYLPDESHPEYRSRLRNLSKRKAELEKEYPQICTKCAATAQSMINRADYYAMSQNASKLVSETHKRKGRAAQRTRDSTSKKIARNTLRLIGLNLNVGLLIQAAFHAYGILTTLFGATLTTSGIGDLFAPTIGECARKSLFLNFSTGCYNLFSSVIPLTLALATVLLWFNPGLKEWYHHTHRIEAVEGQQNYFYMQVVILAIRSIAWLKLSDQAWIAKRDMEQVVAMHGFTVLFMLVAQATAERSISQVRWTIKGKIMPKPDEKDVFSATAGPAVEHYTPKASSKDPWKYLRREDNGPFDINSLAPQCQQKQPVLAPPTYLNYPPSPEFSDHGHPDAMETDYRPVMRSSQHPMSTRPNLQPRHTYMNHTNAPGLGFSDVRNEVFSMEDQMRQEAERNRLEQEQKLHYNPPAKQSPFYGSLPPAPMSMERRLRNPVLRPAEPQKVPLSQQKDFMAQMRRGVKPVHFPEKGTNFELKKSSWVLPGDVKTTGIEDRFTRSFTLDDESPGGAQKKGFLGGLFG